MLHHFEKISPFWNPHIYFRYHYYLISLNTWVHRSIDSLHPSTRGGHSRCGAISWQCLNWSEYSVGSSQGRSGGWMWGGNDGWICCFMGDEFIFVWNHKKIRWACTIVEDVFVGVSGVFSLNCVELMNISWLIVICSSVKSVLARPRFIQSFSKQIFPRTGSIVCNYWVPSCIAMLLGGKILQQIYRMAWFLGGGKLVLGFFSHRLPWFQFASCRFSCEIYPSSTKLAQVYFCMVTELLGDSLYDFLKWNGYRGYWLQEILFFFSKIESPYFVRSFWSLEERLMALGLPDLTMIGQWISLTNWLPDSFLMYL